MYKSYVYHIYSMLILNGFILLFKVRMLRILNGLLYTGTIVPFPTIFCIIWPGLFILGIIIFIHVLYV